jgi:glucose-1-phosphate cytidylyltransferase
LKAVILAGGMGTRISEESHLKPKPMIEIGGKPILWHIMKIYSRHQINDFIICCGYKGNQIREYFVNYALHSSDLTINLESGELIVHSKKVEPWHITLIDTGQITKTGGRLKQTEQYLQGESSFCLTYGDGLTDLDISAEIKFHKANKKFATVCAVRPYGRYGALKIEGSRVLEFAEKPRGDGGWVSGGFFVLSPEVFRFLDEGDIEWESQPLEKLAEIDQLAAFKHDGFWQPMDTLRDKNKLEKLWQSGKAPWRIWQE